jgi:hypothetical protein
MEGKTMTIRINNVVIESDNRSWLCADGMTDITNDETHRFTFLSIVRHIMRERSDCDIVPIIRMAVMHPVNKYGHNVQVEVTYSRKGYRAIYGAHCAGTVTNVQCYMD